MEKVGLQGTSNGLFGMLKLPVTCYELLLVSLRHLRKMAEMALRLPFGLSVHFKFNTDIGLKTTEHWEPK